MQFLRNKQRPHDNTELLSLSRDTGIVMRFIFSMTGGEVITFLFVGGDKLSLQHQGQMPHFTEKVTYSMRIKEPLWKLLGYFLQNARMSILVGATESERGGHM